jgi:hypothetical protein
MSITKQYNFQKGPLQVFIGFTKGVVMADTIFQFGSPLRSFSVVLTRRRCNAV